MIKAMSISEVDSGDLVIELEQVLNRMREQVIRNYQDHGDVKLAAAGITLKIDVAKHPEYDDYCTIGYQITEKQPQRPKGGSTLISTQGETLFQSKNSKVITNPKQVKAEFDQEEDK